MSSPQPVAFGKYSLLDRVNTGGMAEVFRAKAYGVEGFERIVAVKRILPGIAADSDFITMFIDEAKLAVQLNHANIAQIFDLGRVGDSYFIALEYVHGKDLRAIFDHAQKLGRPLPLELTCYVVMKICEGLDYAHRKRDASGRELCLVHRDVSPQNVLVSFDGDVKLIDFGIAKAVGNVSRTGTGILRGKFGYLSPEQVRGDQVDRRSDLFGLGIVLHELLTGERLFVGDSEFSAIEKVRSVDIPRPGERNPSVPAELDAIVMKALAREREERHQTALELHDELQRFLHELGEPCAREQLSAWMLAEFPDEAARDLEMVGDLEGTESITKSALDPSPSVDAPESSAVPKETRGAPEEAQKKRPGTILGLPAVLPPADLIRPESARGTGPSRKLPSQPGLPRSPQPGKRRSVPPPPPPTRTPVPPPPPSARSSQPSASASISTISPGARKSTPPAASALLPAPLAPSTVPLTPSRTNLGVAGAPAQGPSTTLLGTGPAAAPRGPSGALLDMDWDEEDLSTQIYDRPELDASLARIESGLERPIRDYGASDPPVSGFSALRPAALDLDAGAPLATPPPGVHVSPQAFSRSDLFTSEPAPSVRPAPLSTSITAARPQERRNPLYAALAIAAVVLLCFVGYVLLARSEPGVVQLNTVPADAVLLFDGQRVGSISPFIVTGVTPHEKHTLEVQKPGFRSWTQDVQVQPGQPLSLSVALQPGDERAAGAGASAAAAAHPAPGGFSVETAPSGAVVVLDGKPLSGQTPLRVGNLLPRTYDVRVRLDGYREYQTSVDVRSGVDQPLPRIVLTPERIRVRVTSDPSRAEAVLVRGDERRELGRTPVDLTLENDGAPWTLELTKSGRRTYTQELVPRDGAAELSVRAVLERRERRSRRSSREDEDARDGPGYDEDGEWGAPRASGSASGKSDAEDKGGAKESAPSGEGTLRINSLPWSQVVIDGKPIGNTPQMNLKLPAGNHRITLVNPEFNLRKNLTVRIRPGEVETHIIQLQ